MQRARASASYFAQEFTLLMESCLHPLFTDYVPKIQNNRGSGPNAKKHFKHQLSEKLMALRLQHKLKEVQRLHQEPSQP